MSLPRADATGIVASVVSRQLDNRASRIVQLNSDRTSALVALHQMGYTSLYGTSDSRGAYDQPFNTVIRYVYCRDGGTHFPAGFFDCCILTDPQPEHQIGEAARILKVGGLLVTRSGISIRTDAFGLDRSGTSAGSLRVFEKVTDPTATTGALEPTGVSILSYTSMPGGIEEYAKLLQTRFALSGTNCTILGGPADSSDDTVVVEYANGLAKGASLPRDVDMLAAKGKRVIVEVHDTLERFSHEEKARLQSQCTLVYRANEGAERDGVDKYTLAPHVSYLNLPLAPFEAKEGLVLGSFGFAARYKRTGMIIRLARKLGLDLNLVVGLNREIGEEKSKRALTELEKDFGSPISGEGQYSSGRINLRLGFFEPSEIASSMAACSHLVFAHTSSNFQHSGVMTMAKRFSRPIVALESFQAKQAQVNRVQSFWKPEALADSARSFGAALRHGRVELGRLVGDASGILTKESLSADYLVRHRNGLSRDEDGFDYLRTIIGLQARR